MKHRTSKRAETSAANHTGSTLEKTHRTIMTNLCTRGNKTERAHEQKDKRTQKVSEKGGRNTTPEIRHVDKNEVRQQAKQRHRPCDVAHSDGKRSTRAADNLRGHKVWEQTARTAAQKKQKTHRGRKTQKKKTKAKAHSSMEMKRESREAWNSTLQRHLRRRLMAPIACQQSEASHTGAHEKRQGTDGQGRDERPMWLCSHAFGEHARSIFYWRAKWKKDTANREKKRNNNTKKKHASNKIRSKNTLPHSH
ncbi:hypothetical protein TvY486_0032790 [Trypanosoma vivax Y486]|uniref:Uncharacterized protein n=1 Tax=Trypanosoma vivax (strain Y486) TaxID=1055687 RepID=F9WSB5_TRYVY|nr:hypothetical protein TvY486_0032790 [Trypanosoma vivax Y486]|eukprot:CCD20454.1 hypothetical protein TvY486_0032790 [Trypanosoma vivax Y486]